MAACRKSFRDPYLGRRGRRPQAPSQGDSWVILVEVVGFEPTSEKLPRAALQPVETSLTPMGWGEAEAPPRAISPYGGSDHLGSLREQR